MLSLANLATFHDEKRSNYVEFKKYRRYGLGVFFIPSADSMQFNKFVKAAKNDSSIVHQWIICRINSETVVLNAKKIGAALQIRPENVFDFGRKCSFNDIVSRIENKFQAEIYKLIASGLRPTLIDKRTQDFAEMLFDDEWAHPVQIFEGDINSYFMKLVAFRQEGKLRIIRFVDSSLVAIGGFSTVLKVVDVSKGVFNVLKYAKTSFENKKVAESELKNESNAFKILYGSHAREGSHNIGWEIQPSPLFRIPLSFIEATNSNEVISCMLKPYNNKCSLYDFLKKEKMSFEAIIDGCLQLVFGLARFAIQDIFVSDISTRNIWLKSRNNKMFDFRFGDLASLSSKENLKLKFQKKHQIFNCRTTMYRKYQEDSLFDLYVKRINSGIELENSIEMLCKLAKKIDVFSLGVCLFMLIHQDNSHVPYIVEKQKSKDGMELSFAGELSYEIKNEFEFLRPLFAKIFQSKKKRISARQLAWEFYDTIKQKFPKLIAPYETEFNLLKY